MFCPSFNKWRRRKLPPAIEVPYLWTADNEAVSVGSQKRVAQPEWSIGPQRIGDSSSQIVAQGFVRYILNSSRFNVSIKRRSKGRD